MISARKLRNWLGHLCSSSGDLRKLDHFSDFKLQRSRFFSSGLSTLLFVILIFLGLYHLLIKNYYYCCSKTLADENLQLHEPRNNSFVPRIVIWTKYFASGDFGSIGLVENLTFKSCPFTCEVIYATDSKTQLNQNDAVVFHARDLDNTTLPKRQRHPDQVWIFLLQESPVNTQSLQKYDGIFNWTMTYRLDSDVHHPYGLVKANPTIAPTPTTANNATSISKKLAAIIVAHCNTPGNRESLLNDLQDFIPVDIYGICGNLTCPQDQVNKCPDLSCKFEQFRLCLSRLSQSYKFYFAFENSLCVDYISEKFYNVLMTDMVPVVYGGADYSLVAPPHSYINARNFPTVEELAKYLRHLDSNEEEYMKYFDWKKKYHVDLTQCEGWCDLCTKLRSDFTTRQVYESIQTWWNFPVAKKAEAGALTVKSAHACEPKPKYLYRGWRDTRKNARWR